MSDDYNQKWCPFNRSTWAKPSEKSQWATTAEFSFNRARLVVSGEEKLIGACVGPTCAAWRVRKIGKVLKEGYCGMGVQS